MVHKVLEQSLMFEGLFVKGYQNVHDRHVYCFCCSSDKFLVVCFGRWKSGTAKVE